MNEIEIEYKKKINENKMIAQAGEYLSEEESKEKK